jgi:hypothetical protein
LRTFGFRRNGPLYPFLFGTIIPLGLGKLAQEGRALARKRNSTNFLASVDLAGAAFIVECRSRSKHAPPKAEVPLDGADSKLEDYQMDAGTQAARMAV